MTEQERLTCFAEDVYQDVLVRAETEGGEEYLENEFTRFILETLTAAGEIDDEWYVAYHQSRGMKANGYGLSADGDTLYVCYTEYTGERPPRSVTKTEIDTGFRRLRSFVTRALHGDRYRLEESSSGFEMMDQIHAWRDRLDRIRLYFFTDGQTSVDAIGDDEIEGRTATHHVWDIRRTFRCLDSGQQREPVEINFAELPSGPLPCLPMPGSSGEYSAYLLMIPGEVLYRVYDKYGTRLLERNVRAFLQARGKVNKGIRDTIVREPRRFLAYNNGIAATAAEVTEIRRPDGTLAIASVKDFQIVNGGQTTASIYHAVKRDKADISQVSVQAKLSVVAPNVLDELVPVISRFANSQNKVSEADFSANDPFHIALEEISRTSWTPAAPGQQKLTRWFYERARGQYADAMSREGTVARRKAWQGTNPPRQRFTKTDLAKYENSWAQLPFFVGRGAEKNFREFTIRLKDGGSQTVNEEFFHSVVAKAILFRECERLVSKMSFGGYRSQIVTYSLAYLSHATAMRLDLEEIWKMQTLPTSTATALQRIAPAVHDSILAPPGGQNIAEWCKKEACWDAVRALQIDLGKKLEAALIPVGAARAAAAAQRPVSIEAEQEIKQSTTIRSEVWFAVAAWAKETNNLQAWQRGLAYSLGRVVGSSRSPSAKQAHQGLILLAEAKRLGFREDMAEL